MHPRHKWPLYDRYNTKKMSDVQFGGNKANSSNFIAVLIFGLEGRYPPKCAPKKMTPPMLGTLQSRCQIPSLVKIGSLVWALTCSIQFSPRGKCPPEYAPDKKYHPMFDPILHRWYVPSLAKIGKLVWALALTNWNLKICSASGGGTPQNEKTKKKLFAMC